MRHVLALLLILIGSAVCVAERPVDRSFVRHGDVTNDGRPATLTLRITRKSMQCLSPGRSLLPTITGRRFTALFETTRS